MVEQSGSNPLQLVIATAGHVDHGKSSLVRNLTGVETDTLQEEKKRGLTINLGYAYHHYTDPESGTDMCLGFVDVPGHIDFIQNMLAGVGGVNHALLVVAADDGIMPQTLEHLAILELLGVKHLTVAISKIDRADDERLHTVQQALSAELESHGFKLDCFPIDNLTGTGISQLRTHLESLLKPDSASNEPNREQTRFLVDRSFTVKGIGTVVTGSLKTGQITTDSKLFLSSTGAESRIKGLRLDANELDRIESGQRAALNVTLPHESIKRGDWLLAGKPQLDQQRIDVNLRLLDATNTLKNSAHYHLYMGASHYVVNIRALAAQENLYQLRCHSPLVCLHGDRFVLRDPAGHTTIGGGEVLDINVPRRGRSNPERIAFLNALKQPFVAAIDELLQQSAFGFDIDALSHNYNLTADTANAWLKQIQTPFLELIVGDSKTTILIAEQHYRAIERGITQHLDASHQRQPQLKGISEPALSKGLEFAGSHSLFHSILEHMIESGAIKRSGTLLHLPKHQAAISEEEKEFQNKIYPILKSAGKVPPRTRELVEQTNIPLKELESILKITTQSGNLIRVADNRHYLPETIMELADFTEQLASENDNGEFSVIQFRDASGIGRNLCIEILEHFDRIGFTRRDGNARLLRTDKANVFK